MIFMKLDLKTQNSIRIFTPFNFTIECVNHTKMFDIDTFVMD